jgi:excisionase family DNA binding protein
MELLTPQEVAKILKVSKRTVYYWIENSMITHIKVNKKTIRFRPQDIEEFLNTHLIKATDIDKVVDEIVSKLS